jgi:hypothetical protein
LSHSIATDCAHHKFTESKFIGCNLPSSITHLTLGYYFNQKVENFPKELKKIKCSKEYKYLKDFKNYEVEII